MSQFSIDIEKYYEELTAMGRQLKGVFCIQYPIFCIHSKISDSTPDPLENLDTVIVDFISVKHDFNSFQIGSIIGTSKALVERRIDKLISDNLLSKDVNGYYLTEYGVSVFKTKTMLRLNQRSYDLFVDGITLKPLPKVFYQYYKSKFISEHYSFYRTNKKTSETYIVKPFAPDIVHTPPDKNLISEFVLAIDSGKRDDFCIPQGLQSIDDISFTKMSFQVLISVSKSVNGMSKELIDGHAIYSLSDDLTYYDTLRKNVKLFEPQLKERIQNLVFKLMMPFQKNDSNEMSMPYLTTNWPEIDRHKDSYNKCFNFSSEDLIRFLQIDRPNGFGIKEVELENIVNDEDDIIINIRQNHLLKSSDRHKLVNDLIRKRDYNMSFNANLERNVFLFYIYFSTDDIVVKELLEFIKYVKEYQQFSFARFIETHSKYSDKIRQLLLLAGELDLLEKFDIENHMIDVSSWK